MIGSGNENNSVSKLVASVFLMIFVKSVEKKYLNQSRPTNCEFTISAKIAATLRRVVDEGHIQSCHWCIADQNDPYQRWNQQ